MRYNNVKFTALATYSDGSMSNFRAFASEKAMSNWANKQFDKDEDCTVTVWVGYTDTVYCIYMREMGMLPIHLETKGI